MSGYSIFANVKQSVSYLDALSADPTLSKCVTGNVQIRYGARRDCQPTPNDPARMDAFMEELLNTVKSGGVLWDDRYNDNLAKNICAIADLKNPLICAPSTTQNIPTHKELWMQPDTKKLMCRQVIKSDDCCENTPLWVEISGGHPIASATPYFIGASDETPHDGAQQWFQPDTGKLLNKETQGANSFWVEE